jgi:hypothetical protein
MLDVAYYLVTREILERAGLAGQRYRSKDGRYVLDNKDLSRVRFTSEEYISGLQGVEKITAEQAKQAIAEGGYQMQSLTPNPGLTPNPSPKGEGSEQPATEGSEQPDADGSEQPDADGSEQPDADGSEQPAEPEQEEEQPAESVPSDSVAGSEEVEPTQEEEE